MFGTPLSVAAAVIQIQNGRHSVDAKSVCVELFQPKQRIGNQEIFYFVLSKVEYLCSPSQGVLPFSDLRISYWHVPSKFASP